MAADRFPAKSSVTFEIRAEHPNTPNSSGIARAAANPDRARYPTYSPASNCSRTASRISSMGGRARYPGTANLAITVPSGAKWKTPGWECRRRRPPRIFLVQHTECGNMLAVFIPQQWKTQLFAGVKLRKFLNPIIGHARHLDAQCLEPGAPLFQLNQLALAEGSPVRRAGQEQQQTALPGQGI